MRFLGAAIFTVRNASGLLFFVNCGASDVPSASSHSAKVVDKKVINKNKTGNCSPREYSDQCISTAERSKKAVEESSHYLWFNLGFASHEGLFLFFVDEEALKRVRLFVHPEIPVTRFGHLGRGWMFVFSFLISFTIFALLANDLSKIKHFCVNRE